MVRPYSIKANKNSDPARSFLPVFEADAKIMILGSMPGIASLQARQYYAHPQNAFWPIIEDLFGVSDALDYIERTRLLIRNRIALWDVLRSCVRNGSLDSSIKASSIIANDFSSFFARAPELQAIVFNGVTAQREYMKRIIPTLSEQVASLPNYRLPSTSPAMAGITKKQKLEQWRLIKEILT